MTLSLTTTKTHPLLVCSGPMANICTAADMLNNDDAEFANSEWRLLCDVLVYGEVDEAIDSRSHVIRSTGNPDELAAQMIDWRVGFFVEYADDIKAGIIDPTDFNLPSKYRATSLSRYDVPSKQPGESQDDFESRCERFINEHGR